MAQAGAELLHAEYLVSLDDLAKKDLDVLIVGSGPAGTAVAEYLYLESDKTIGVLERGPLLVTTHVNNILRDGVANPAAGTSKQRARAAFISALEVCLWQGDFNPGGILILGLGGRGIVAGAHLTRFYRSDYDLWDNGRWPIGQFDLDEEYAKAEAIRNVSHGECEGRMQDWVLNQLNSRNAHEPPWGLDVRSSKNANTSRGFDSSVARLWGLLVDDHMGCKNDGCDRRLWVATRAFATRIVTQGDRVTAVACKDTRKDPTTSEIRLRAKAVVLTASTIESARLALTSGLGGEAAGRYLAEHIFCRGDILVPARSPFLHDQYVNVIVPPSDRSLAHRFHVHLIGEPAPPEHPGYVNIRVTGEAAMDPNPENRVTIGADLSDYGVPKAHITFRHSEADEARTKVMAVCMKDIAKELRSNFVEEPYLMKPGKSHHEAGTLRMGLDPKTSVVDPFGKFHDLQNLFVADASVFPCVGVANPMLTITAWAYRVAKRILGKLP